ncbi:hypothetical protein N7454_008258 [Penicillium verhagenii]|nr:hypothetical protein N7454_008258 [Penicillium verhagenii]
MPPKYPPKKYYRWSEDLNKVLFAAVLKNHTIEVDKLIDNWPIDEAPPISRALRDHLLKIKNEGSALARQANEKLNAERKAEAAAHSRAEKGDRPSLLTELPRSMARSAVKALKRKREIVPRKSSMMGAMFPRSGSLKKICTSKG